jgi:hypothetical protein
MLEQENPAALLPAVAAIENPLHAIFVAEMIATGNRRIAYQKAYPRTENASARTAACRLIARPEIANAIREGLIEMQQQALETVRKKYEGMLTDVDEKRIVLAQIIRGELTTERETTSKKGETQTMKVKADPKDRMRAILIDNKMEEKWNRIMNIPDEGMRYVE